MGLTDLVEFWEREVKPRFREVDIESMVSLSDGSEVKYVNLDNAATTIPFRSVIEKIINSLSEYGSVHRGSGQHSKVTTARYEHVRETIRRFVGASSDDYIIFTSNTTTAVHLAASLWAQRSGFILVSDAEHSSNLTPWVQHEHIKNNGRVVREYNTNPDGTIDIEQIRQCFERANNDDEKIKTFTTNSLRIKLLAVTGASNLTGYKPQIYELAKLAHSYGAKIFVDACQLLQHEQIDMLPDDDPCHIDFIAFSGHKMYAPFGAGVLVGPKDFFDGRDLPAPFFGIDFLNLVYGSVYQLGGGNIPYIDSGGNVLRPKIERAHEPGTPNFAGAIAIEEAIILLEEIGMNRIKEYEHQLVALALDGMMKISNVKIYLPKNKICYPKDETGDYIIGSVIPFDIEGLPHKLVAEILAQEYGIGVRAGSFCTYELIRKLKGITKEQDQEITKEVLSGVTANIPGLVRASFSMINNLEDVNRFVSAISEISGKDIGYYRQRYELDERTGEWRVK
ncbi:aminotransferase class V-fold PLP-dependent enzyme [Candidatus Woesearchaeota archaeon]|nr:aminotransferase class V-fold PLP-dependent enzyme [Candidatus Woesearchaeota archaeon]